MAFPFGGRAQNAYAPQAQQYAIAGNLLGDQVFPDIQVAASGGYVVWEDNLTDGSGLGLSARWLNNSFSGQLASFQVNEQGDLDQEHPRLALFPDGGAVFVWQGGRPGFQHIYARFLAADGTFVTGDVQVDSANGENQIGPAVAVLANGSVVVAWTSYGNGPTMLDVWAQRFSATGQKLGPEFKVNRFDAQNQRSPAVTALSNGNFAVAWVTEFVSNLRVTDFNTTNAVTANAIVYCRIFDAQGLPVTDDLRAGLYEVPICANPVIASLSDGGLTVVWNQRDTLDRNNGWDIYGRAFSATGLTNGLPVRLNVFTYGDQFAPRIAAIGADQMVVWNSLGQDGSQEGVYGRYLHNGQPSSEEFLVNREYTVSKQIHPAVAADPSGRFLVVWTSFIGGSSSFDLYAQRYVSIGVVTDPPSAPYVVALSASELAVSWPELAGFFNLQHYELFIDKDTNPTPITLTNNYYVVTGLPPGSAHRLNLAYRFKDGTLSPLSAAAKATTWGLDANFDGLPDSWQQMYWGPNPENWPSPNVDSDHDGANNLLEFLSGTSPVDAASVLQTHLTLTPEGGRLTWNSEPGYMYQVQKSVNFNGWENYGSLRRAADTSDSVLVGSLNEAEFYRVIRVR